MTAPDHDCGHVSARLAALDQRYLDGGGSSGLVLAGGGGVAAAVAAARRECEARADLQIQTQVRSCQRRSPVTKTRTGAL